MRERLIELIGNEPNSVDSIVAHADYLLTNGVIHIPCKIGDDVYVIRHYRNGIRHIQKGTVHEMFFTRNMELCISVKHIARGKWGETIFPTMEEAEQALKGGDTDA